MEVDVAATTRTVQTVQSFPHSIQQQLVTQHLRVTKLGINLIATPLTQSLLHQHQ